jgi:uncharacterized Zn finger protein (UPF0148 family)
MTAAEKELIERAKAADASATDGPWRFVPAPDVNASKAVQAQYTDGTYGHEIAGWPGAEDWHCTYKGKCKHHRQSGVTCPVHGKKNRKLAEREDADARFIADARELVPKLTSALIEAIEQRDARAHAAKPATAMKLAKIRQAHEDGCLDNHTFENCTLARAAIATLDASL